MYVHKSMHKSIGMHAYTHLKSYSPFPSPSFSINTCTNLICVSKRPEKERFGQVKLCFKCHTCKPHKGCSHKFSNFLALLVPVKHMSGISLLNNPVLRLQGVSWSPATKSERSILKYMGHFQSIITHHKHFEYRKLEVSKFWSNSKRIPDTANRGMHERNCLVGWLLATSASTGQSNIAMCLSKFLDRPFQVSTENPWFSDTDFIINID